MTSDSHRRPPRGLFVGLATVDISYTVDRIPRSNQKISVTDQRISAGGPATTAAVTFAALGGRAALVTAVGRHPMAAIVVEDLKQSAVALHDLAQSEEHPPPVSSILVTRSTGERAVVSANSAIFAPAPTEFNARWLTGVSIVQVDGHYMPLCIAAAGCAQLRGIPVVLESGSWKPGMCELLPFVSIAICSADFRAPGCRDADDVFEYFAARGVRYVAITQGADPLLFVDRRKKGQIAVKKVRSVDTLGAGDVFHGAFCHHMSQSGVSFRDALKFAAQVATLSCRYPGTRSWRQAFAAARILR